MQRNVHEELDRVGDWSRPELVEFMVGLAFKVGPLPYEEILVQAQLLSLEDRVRLLGELIADLKEGIGNVQSHSITELRGVGKELWQGIDVEKYIEEERSSWDG